MGVSVATNDGQKLGSQMFKSSILCASLDAGNPSVVYAGTGNLFSNGGVNQPIPAIVYKSYDAGWSWWPLSLPSGTYTIKDGFSRGEPTVGRYRQWAVSID
jgi:hypothetical protein